MAAQQDIPTLDKIREARNQGFANAISHFPQDTRYRLAYLYGKQTARREKRVQKLLVEANRRVPQR